MTNTFAITIGIPVYNVENYVERSILSALNQDFKLPFEILIVDDCGTDSSMKIVHDLVSTHPCGNKARIISHETNRGLGEVRNTIIRNAIGEYLYFLDSDDWMMPNTLTILYNAAIQSKAQITIGSTHKVDEDGNTIEDFIYPSTTIKHHSAGAYMEYSGICSPLVAYWNKLFLLDFVKKSEMYCIHRIFEDVIPDFRAKLCAEVITLVSDITLVYLERRSSIMDSLWKDEKRSQETMDTIAGIMQYMRKSIPLEFASCKGAYDLYFQTLFKYFWVFRQSPIDLAKYEALLCFEKDCINFIPSFHSVYSRNARLIYLLLNNHPQDMAHLVKAYTFVCTPLGRVIKYILGIL